VMFFKPDFAKYSAAMCYIDLIQVAQLTGSLGHGLKLFETTQ